MKEIKKIKYELDYTRGQLFETQTQDSSDFKDIVETYIKDFELETPNKETYFRVERWEEEEDCDHCDGDGTIEVTQYEENEDGEEEEYTDYEDCDYCEDGKIKNFKNEHYQPMGKIRKLLGNRNYIGIYHYHHYEEYDEENKGIGNLVTSIVVSYDCTCPCSELTIATIHWK